MEIQKLLKMVHDDQKAVSHHPNTLCTTIRIQDWNAVLVHAICVVDGDGFMMDPHGYENMAHWLGDEACDGPELDAKTVVSVINPIHVILFHYNSYGDHFYMAVVDESRKTFLLRTLVCGYEYVGECAS